ncbi:MAG TPA: ABC transporter permease subunit, partial [Gemmataceae bacterium]
SSIGAEREGQSLIWLLTRPLPRSAVYLGKLLATLPWALGFNLAGFALICLAAGPVGQRAFALYWPAVAAGTLAFTALFHLIGAVFRRPAVVALLYAFFIEALVGDLPGTLKRVSISYYTRCLMYHEARGQGVELEDSAVFVPVSPETAWAVLLGATVALTLVGMAVFARSEYRDDAG